MRLTADNLGADSIPRIQEIFSNYPGWDTAPLERRKLLRSCMGAYFTPVNMQAWDLNGGPPATAITVVDGLCEWPDHRPDASPFLLLINLLANSTDYDIDTIQELKKMEFLVREALRNEPAVAPPAPGPVPAIGKPLVLRDPLRWEEFDLTVPLDQAARYLYAREKEPLSVLGVNSSNWKFVQTISGRLASRRTGHFIEVLETADLNSSHGGLEPGLNTIWDAADILAFRDALLPILVPPGIAGWQEAETFVRQASAHLQEISARNVMGGGLGIRRLILLLAGSDRPAGFLEEAESSGMARLCVYDLGTPKFQKWDVEEWLTGATELVTSKPHGFAGQLAECFHAHCGGGAELSPDRVYPHLIELTEALWRQPYYPAIISELCKVSQFYKRLAPTKVK